MIEMKPELLAALHTSLDAGGWRAVGVNADRQEHTTPGNPSADPPVADVTTVTTTTVITAEHEGMQLALVFILAGDGEGYTSLKMMAGGGSFETDDSLLIARLVQSIEPATDAMQAALVEQLQAA